MSDTRPMMPAGFAELDALLDRALQLEGSALREFLETLNEEQRGHIEALLERAHSTEVDEIAETARRSAFSQQPQAPDKPAPRAGRWQLKHELGSGGMGQVFFAVREEDDYAQQAAVKVLWSHRADASFKARFYRERRILASLDHPGLARFLDGGLLADGRPWFAMEYVDGTNVAEYAATLPEAERLELFLAICEPVQYAHERLIVHRDIKPQNILVNQSGQPRLLDFGVATILGDLKDSVRTRTGAGLLTLQYASPEQVDGSVITVGSDVYQLGLLLYQMLAGRPPFYVADKSLRETLDRICKQPVPPPSEFNRELSGDLDAIVLCALRKDPAERYHSAEALGSDIRRYLDGYPVGARPQSGWYVAKRFVQRNFATVGLLALVAVALTTATAVSLRMADEARAEAERSQKTQQILADVFQQADPYGNAGGEVTLADALVAAKPSIAEQLEGDDKLAWEVNNTLGEIFSSLGLVEDEQAAYESALAAARALEGDNEREVVTAVAGLGNVLVRDNPAAAVEFFARELPGEIESPAVARAWLAAKYAEVNALTRLRDFERADRAIGEMAAAADRFGLDTPRGRGRLSQLLAGRATRAGDLDAADRHWNDAVAHMLDADNPFALAVTLSNQGIFLGQNGRYEESDAVFQRSLGVFEQHAPDDPTHASVLRTYSGLLIRMGRQGAAIDRLHTALSILDGKEEHYTRYVVLLSLADYALIAGRVEESLEAAVEGLSLALAEFGADSRLTQRMLAHFSRLLTLAGRGELALSLLLPAADAPQVPDATHLALAEAALDIGHTELARANLDRLEASGSLSSRRIGLRLQCALGDRSALQRQLAGAPQGDEDAGDAVRHYRVWELLMNAYVSLPAAANDATSLAQAMSVYRSSDFVSLDALDRQRMLKVFERLAAPSVAPANLQQQIEAAADIAATTRELLNTRFSEPVGSILAAFPTPAAGDLAAGASTVDEQGPCGPLPSR
ncbi:MAG: serine/threonine-protein kinase [Pseudomonadota bacterium]